MREFWHFKIHFKCTHSRHYAEWERLVFSILCDSIDNKRYQGLGFGVEESLATKVSTGTSLEYWNYSLVFSKHKLHLANTISLPPGLLHSITPFSIQFPLNLL